MHVVRRNSDQLRRFRMKNGGTTDGDHANTAYVRSKEWVLDALRVDPEQGLSENEAAVRRAEYGTNEIGTWRRTSYWRILVNQFRGAVVWLLFAAAALSFWLGDVAEGVAIVVVLVINTLIGFFTEARAATSMDALRKLTRTTARVRRAGREIRVDADDLVPGDIVLLEAGDVVPADLRLLSSVDLHTDESTLTGESVPVAKSTEAIGRTVPLADRRNMVFRGTSVTRGNAVAITAATGSRTQLGEITEMVAGAEAESSPLEERLAQLGWHLALAALAVSIAIAAAGVFTGRPLFEMLETAIALAVAAVPEGLPIVATLSLARGMWRMAARNVLINRLSAVETLGSTNILLTDKTGTLTENRMSVELLLFSDGEIRTEEVSEKKKPPQVEAAIRTMVLCNDAVLGPSHDDSEGDPMEVALLRAANDMGLDPVAVGRTCPRQRSIAFDPDIKMMATVNADEAGTRVHVKGAPEAVLAASTRVLGANGEIKLTSDLRRDIEARIEAAGATGLRMLGLAQRDDADDEQVYSELTLIGFVGLQDPARPEVPAAIADCLRAGVRVIMVTGDHKETARKIASEVGLVKGHDVHVSDGVELAQARELPEAAQELLGIDVFARVPPREKLTLVALHQQNNSIVAMTGDGVNDAPALQKADIGIAMGKRGTQVAAEASDIILRDDAFGSIVEAMRQGRIVYSNIRMFVRYLFTCNLSEIALIAVAMLAGVPMPLTPLQILFLNLITDIFPAIALGMGEGARDVMRVAPRRPDEPLVTRRRWKGIVAEGALIGLCAFGAFLIELVRSGVETATGVAFLTICIAQLLFVFVMYPRGEALFSSEITRNGYVWFAVFFSTGLMLAGTYLPPLSDVLGIQPPDLEGWATILVAGSAPAAVILVTRRLFLR
ncbi:cation-transporting P-type ATPase [Ruegeria sediminis]|uniref:Cation-transporting P-type ATPase n=1 Tax=Ruegeria sediminis TaxID=2583820 RepID=A0ABY2WS55_9RHOB|nr:cation-transporting P-type ATPase [Ruegeria sediminis]TMV03262.1 cation-transporting P-type ATPase [Ruegeria sediminis]